MIFIIYRLSIRVIKHCDYLQIVVVMITLKLKLKDNTEKTVNVREDQNVLNLIRMSLKEFNIPINEVKCFFPIYDEKFDVHFLNDYIDLLSFKNGITLREVLDNYYIEKVFPDDLACEKCTSNFT